MTAYQVQFTNESGGDVNFINDSGDEVIFTTENGEPVQPPGYAPNGIGEFIIGESSIGDQPFYWPNTLYSQYANSGVMYPLLDYFSQWIDANGSVDGFYDNVWNVETAQGWGLDVWGRIVGVNRVIPGVQSKYFGFEEAGDLSADPFNQSPFYSGEALNGNFTLSDSSFRLLILAKAASNIWNGTITGLNSILRTLFPGQICYVTDGQNMTMTYTFMFTLTSVQIAIIQNTGVLPRPAGVSFTIVQG